MKETLGGVLQLASDWILLNRYGDFQARRFSEGELTTLVDLLIDSYPTVGREGDDQYLMFDEGLAIYLTDVPATGILLVCLNAMGAQIELFSKGANKRD